MSASKETIHVDCVVIGAGWTGLSVAAALRSYGVSNFVILESGQSVGSFWEGNYDRIRLHTPWHSLPCDKGLALYKYPMFKPKRDIIKYLDDYHRLHHLEPHMRLGERVVKVVRESVGNWRIDIAAEWGCREYRSRFVAVCTSKLRVPFIPHINGSELFQGRLLHSREYRTGKAFRNKNVLVVGSGNSAAEICADLVECGAKYVTMLVYGPRLFVPLPRLAWQAWIGRILGMLGETGAFKNWLLEFGTPEYWQVVKSQDARMSSLAVNMTQHGISKPDLGFSEANIKHGRIGTFDQGAIAMRGDGRIAVHKAKLVGFTEHEACLSDGSIFFSDAVVLATGFQPKLEDFIEDVDLLLVREQEGKGCGTSYLTPRTNGRGRSTVDGSIFFVGFDQAVNGGLAMGFWGWSIGFLIAQGLGLQPIDKKFGLDTLPELQSDVCRRKARQVFSIFLLGAMTMLLGRVTRRKLQGAL